MLSRRKAAIEGAVAAHLRAADLGLVDAAAGKTEADGSDDSHPRCQALVIGNDAYDGRS